MEKEVLTEAVGPLVGSEVIGEREGEDVGWFVTGLSVGLLEGCISIWELDIWSRIKAILISYVERENLTEVVGLFVGLSEGDDVGLADGELVIGEVVGWGW